MRLLSMRIQSGTICARDAWWVMSHWALALLMAATLEDAGFGDPVPMPGYNSIDRHEVDIDSGVVSATGQGEEPVVVYSQIIAVEGVPWMRLHFSSVQLSGSATAGNESYLSITSQEDADFQLLDSRGLGDWRNTTAFFNGDSVLLELLAYRNTGGNRVIVDWIVTGTDDPGSGLKSICGTDDRQPSDDPRTGRMRLFIDSACEILETCTAFLIDGRPNWLLTAGHCCAAINWEDCEGMPVFPAVVQFNDFAPRDQYPVDEESVPQSHYQDSGPGNDWCVLGVRGNWVHDTPLEGQNGAFYRLPKTDVPDADDTVLAMTGYGFDDDNPSYSGRQQTGKGIYVGGGNGEVHYDIDTEGGNSGSPVEHECRGLVYAIHTHGPCDTLGYNIGTALDNRFLQNALENPTGVCADCNVNDIADGCDINCGSPGGACDVPGCGQSSDRNLNDIPDECEPQEDCQPNSVQDICDIASGTSDDLDGNMIPDECEDSVGGCCMTDDSCVAMSDVCCDQAGGVFGGDGVGCEGGACCLDNATCAQLNEACRVAEGATFVGPSTGCTPERACCLPDATCVDTSQACCAQEGGAWFGIFTCQEIGHHCVGQYGPVGW